MGTTEVNQGREASVHIRIPPFVLEGTLTIPAGAQGIALFAHTRGKSRAGRRVRLLAETLNRAGIATGLVDLLTGDEERGGGAARRPRFDLDLIAGRLGVLTDWVRADRATRDLRIGYLALDAGDAAALMAASDRTGEVQAIVVAGRHPELAGTALASVRAPTLLVASQQDRAALELNSRAYQAIGAAEKRLEVVPSTGSSFRKRLPVDRIAELSIQWFRHWFGRHLMPSGSLH